MRATGADLGAHAATHLRGTRWQYKLEKPDGTSEVVLDVPHYDFNWQTFYLFDKPLEVPAGGKLTSMAWYDNSASNTHNPDATKDVKWGDQTWEEMQYTGFLYSVPSRRLKPAGGRAEQFQETRRDPRAPPRPRLDRLSRAPHANFFAASTSSSIADSARRSS